MQKRIIFLKMKLMHHNAEVKVHDHLLGIIEHIHPEGSLSTHVWYDLQRHEDALQGCHHLYGPESVENSQYCCYGDTIEDGEKKKTYSKDL